MRDRAQSDVHPQRDYQEWDAHNSSSPMIPENNVLNQFRSSSTTEQQRDPHRQQTGDLGYDPYDGRAASASEVTLTGTESRAVHQSHNYGGTEQALLTRYSCNPDLFQTDVATQIGTYVQTGTQVLVKRVLKDSGLEVDSIRRQIAVLEAVQDPAVPPLVEWLELDEAIWLVQEHRASQSLGDVIRASGGPLSEHVVKTVMNQLFSSVASLFMAGFAHLRIDDATVHLDSHQRVVITGLEHVYSYGKERIGDVYAPIRDKQGSSDIYVAPEVFSSNLYNARKAVMWSCGVLLYFISTGQTDKLSNLEHPSFDKLNREIDVPEPESSSGHRRRISVAHAQSKVIMYPSRFAVANFARAIISKMLVHDPRRRAELIEVASRVPKDFSSKDTRPLMELAWLDYKTHVGPNAELHAPNGGNESSASSIFSAVSRLSNPFGSLLHRGESRRKSAPATSKFRWG